MGAQVIGLDVGTHAARAVELSLGRGRPVVRRMAQVTLPRGAVVGGEVIDPGAVSTCLRRLWREGGFRSRSVVVGVANPRVVARLTDLPAMPDDELRTSLPFHVQDLIPIPLEEAQLDFQVIERGLEVEGEERVRVLLVAAHRDMLRNLLAAVEGAGLAATRVDLVPLALIRAVEWQPVVEDDGAPSGFEMIIGSGAGVTNVVIHQDGVARFVRTLAIGGAAVTDAIAEELGIEADDAEAAKRGIGTSSDAPQLDRIAARSIAPLASEVAGSLEFHRSQGGETALRRVVLSGAGGRLGVLRSVLEDRLGVPVVHVDPLAGLDLSKVPLDAATIERTGDSFTVAVGLALSGGLAHNVSLLPPEAAHRKAARRNVALAGAGVGVLVLGLTGATALRSHQIDDARHAAAQADAHAATLTVQVGGLHDVEQLEGDITVRRASVAAALTGDVAWPALLQRLTAALPDDVWLTSVNASRTAGGPGAPAVGTLQVTAAGFDQTSAAHWLSRAGDLPALANPWMSSSTRSDADGKQVVLFTANADLTAAAQSDRNGAYAGGKP